MLNGSMLKKFILISLLILSLNIHVLNGSNQTLIPSNNAIKDEANWGNLWIEGHEIDLKAAELAHRKLKGGHYDSKLHAVIPTDIVQTEKEWKKAKDYIAQLIGPLPSLVFQDLTLWKNSATTIDDLLRDARLMAPFFKADFEYIASITGAETYFGINDQHIVKTRESLVSKVQRDAKNLQITEEEAIGKISDTLRGTLIVDDIFQIASVIAEIIHYVDYKDGQVIFKNLWKEDRKQDGYVGIHAKMLLPIWPLENPAEQRYIITEMQIHFRFIEDGTDQCAKEREHTVYEQIRSENYDPATLTAASRLLYLTAMQEIIDSLGEKK
jgi:hypothetical protein